MKKSCPFSNCDEECDPVTDPISEQPFAILGRGRVYYCSHHGHWDEKTPKSGRRFLEEQPAPTGKGVISVPIVDKAQPYGFGVGRFMV